MTKRTRLYSRLITLCLALLASTPAAAERATLEGWLSIAWGDPQGGAQSAHQRVTLSDEQGQTTELLVSDALLKHGVWRWNGRRVKVFAPHETPLMLTDGTFQVAAIQLAADQDTLATRGAVIGSEPWISLLCKFADIADEPEDLTYFQSMYANVPGGLDHYWRELSYDAIDIVGSIAIDWVSLPEDQTHYVPTPGSGTSADLHAIFNDCTATVDDLVDFSGGGTPFAGINIMLNASLDCCAWGGSRFATLDGVTKSWRTTWNPPWAYSNEGVIAHEMGHGLGLPHANNFDDDGNPYDSPWDVMSSATGYAVDDAIYGRLGKHINAYHKDSLGWFPEARRFVAQNNAMQTILLDHTALDRADNYQIAIIPVDSSRWYTVEARLREGHYDAALAGDAVIIHQIDLGRSQPSWAVDGDVPPADYGDNPGTMWIPGETYTNEAHDFSISIDADTATGFVITIEVGDPDIIYDNGFDLPSP